MKPIPDPLQRLFRWSRAAARSPVAGAPPPGFATRVLAELREPVERDWLLWLLPRAVALAGVAVVATFVPGGGGHAPRPEAELATLVLEHALTDTP
jgi:hypothetical protein